MEQYHNSQQMTGRLYCETESCSDQRTHFCSDHDQVLCASCSINFHQKCRSSKIPDAKDVADCLDITKSVLSSINQDSEHFKTNPIIKSLDEELKKFTEMLSMINEKFANSVENSNSHEFCSILKEVVQLQKELIKSGLLAQSNISAELKLALSEEHLSCCMVAELQESANESTLICCQRDPNEIDHNYQSKIKNERLSCLAYHIDSKRDNKATENQTENTQKENSLKEDIQKTLKQTNEPIQHVRNSKKVVNNRLEKQKHVISDTTWKDIKQKELNILKQEYEIREVVFSRIYQRHTGEKIQDISSFYLEISLNDAKQKLLMRDCVTCRFGLPDLNGIWVDEISDVDADADLASFLCDCTPTRLNLLVVNFYINSFTCIKSKFYVDALSRAAARTTKEVYFVYIDFSAEDLQTVVRAAHNTERIMFCSCCIHCSSSLDFGADLNYNTKFLSFQGCGSTDYKQITTDWKADPSKFSLIVDAIGSSGLEASLEKLSIAYNPTLSTSEVQKELNAKGMSHISVVEENPGPLTS